MSHIQAPSSHPLAAYGGSCLKSYNLRGGADHEIFNYSDLARETPLIDEVLECDSRPLIYLLRHDALVSNRDVHIDELCQILANRGEAAYLGVLEPGRLRLFPCLFEESSKFEAVVKEDDVHAPSLLADLSQGITHDSLKEAQKKLSQSNLREKMLTVLEYAGKCIDVNFPKKTQSKNAKVQIVLGLIGRVLFTRFLFDRKLLPEDQFAKVEYTQWFSTAINAAKLCTWLDVTFNGDLLPLINKSSCSDDEDKVYQEYLTFFEGIYDSSGMIAHTLYNLFMGAADDQQYKLLTLLDFAHIPVGLLSEAYEDFAHHFDAENAQKTSIHFTPRHIAETMVNQAFEGVSPDARHQAKLLDPSAGAGVFLVAALRRLVQERLRAGLPVTTGDIRDVLYDQVRGFDINPHALSLASLALYLTAIELDPDPEPVSKLRFDKKLLGTTLHCVGGSDSNLGSLGSAVPNSFNDQFDIVIGNPPWTAQKNNLSLRNTAKKIVMRVLGSRISSVEDSEHQETLKRLLEKITSGHVEATPDYVPDLPFIWRSMEWAKSDAVIAFALHSRLLFKQTEVGVKARNVLFRTLRVTGIVNGSDLRQTDVWAGISAPFCLFFAKNSIPDPSDVFLYLNPYREGVNQQGRMRLDPARTHWVSIEELESHPTVLKTYFRGTSLDLRIVEKIRAGGRRGAVDIKSYWRKELGLSVGEGYIKGRSGKEDATWMLDLNAKHVNESLAWDNGFINPADLPDFQLESDASRMHRTCDKKIYLPPLLLLWRCFSGKKAKDVGLYFGDKPLVYKERHIGFSAHGHPEGESLLAYIFILLNSVLARYFFLMSSSGYGVERESLNTGDIYSLPIIPFSKLSTSERKEVRSFLDKMWNPKEDQIKLQKKINSWVCSLYGLNKSDENSMTDSVELFQERSRAESAPSNSQLKAFIDSLKDDIDELYAFYDVASGAEFDIVQTPLESWTFIEVRRKGLPPSSWDQSRLGFFAQCATEEGASEIHLYQESGRILIGRLSQVRYWTKSQSRLCGMSIIPQMSEKKNCWGLDPDAEDGLSA